VKKVYIVSFLLLVLLVTATSLYRNKINTIKNKDIATHHLIDSFNRLSRTEQVKTCGSCHVKEYENEMKGPHGSAFMMLQKHLAYVDSKQYNDAGYKSYINEKRTSCISCHASDNQYEKILKTVAENQDSFLVYLDHADRQPPIRKANKDNFLTGIDCLSCHYDGNRVVTNLGFESKNHAASPPYCNPKGTILFSHSNACVTCHTDEYKGLVKMQGIKSNDCLACHQQYDNKGKGTHYIYWRHDDKDHPKPENLKIMDDITATYDATGGRVIVKWHNTRLPHPLVVFTEPIAYFEVVDGSGKMLGKGEIRLNGRDAYNKNMIERGYKALPGISGVSLPLDGSSIYDTIPNIKVSKSGSIELKITGGEKSQYWLPDSTIIYSFHKTIKL
jgi:hypothetical protein